MYADDIVLYAHSRTEAEKLLIHSQIAHCSLRLIHCCLNRHVLLWEEGLQVVTELNRDNSSF